MAQRLPDELILNRYQVITELDESSQLPVYLANSENGLVAIKELSPVNVTNPAQFEKYRLSFAKQAIVAEGLNGNPNVANIYEIGLEHGAYYLVEEYISGGTLAEALVLRKGLPLMLRRVYQIGVGIARGLEVIQADPRRIVHGDLTPENIFLTKTGLPKISNFGKARLGEQSSALFPGHDLQSLGLILFQIATGKPNYSLEELELSSRPPSILPATLKAIIEKAISPDPEVRYQESGILRNHLEKSQLNQITVEDIFLPEKVQSFAVLLPPVETSPAVEPVETLPPLAALSTEQTQTENYFEPLPEPVVVYDIVEILPVETDAPTEIVTASVKLITVDAGEEVQLEAVLNDGQTALVEPVETTWDEPAVVEIIESATAAIPLEAILEEETPQQVGFPDIAQYAENVSPVEVEAIEVQPVDTWAVNSISGNGPASVVEETAVSNLELVEEAPGPTGLIEPEFDVPVENVPQSALLNTIEQIVAQGAVSGIAEPSASIADAPAQEKFGSELLDTVPVTPEVHPKWETYSEESLEEVTHSPFFKAIEQIVAEASSPPLFHPEELALSETEEPAVIEQSFPDLEDQAVQNTAVPFVVTPEILPPAAVTPEIQQDLAGIQPIFADSSVAAVAELDAAPIVLAPEPATLKPEYISERPETSEADKVPALENTVEVQAAPLATGISGFTLAWVYLLLEGVAEIVTGSINIQAGLFLHAILMLGLLLYHGFGKDNGLRKLALALITAPLIRILSLSLPLGLFPQLAWYPMVAVPLLVSAWFIGRQIGITRQEVGFRLGMVGPQLMFIPIGIALGIGEYMILRPAPLIDNISLNSILVPALILVAFTGFNEEIIFRGLLQATAQPVLKKSALLYVSLLFGVLHITYLSFFDFVFVFAVGWLFSYVRLWTGSVLGVSLAHGLTNVTLFLIMPYLMNNSFDASNELIIWLGVAGAVSALLGIGQMLLNRRNGTVRPNSPVEPQTIGIPSSQI